MRDAKIAVAIIVVVAASMMALMAVEIHRLRHEVIRWKTEALINARMLELYRGSNE